MPSIAVAGTTECGDGGVVTTTSGGAGAARAVIQTVQVKELAPEVLVTVGDELLGEVWVEVHGSAFRGWWYRRRVDGACRERAGASSGWERTRRRDGRGERASTRVGEVAARARQPRRAAAPPTGATPNDLRYVDWIMASPPPSVGVPGAGTS